MFSRSFSDICVLGTGISTLSLGSLTYLFCALATVMLPTLASAQTRNLVPNESFEERDSTIVIGQPVPCPNESGEISLVTEWVSAGGSIDYFHSCAVGSEYPDYGVPTNLFGSQQAYDGEAYVLFGAIADNHLNWREWIEVQLKEPLKKDEVYELSFYVNLTDDSRYVVQEIGGLLTQETTSDYSGSLFFSAEPQVENTSVDLNEKDDWLEVSGEFIATGGEEYLTIGCFREYQNLTVDTLDYSSPMYVNNCSYYLDMVSLVKVGTVGIEGAEALETTVYPNPTADGSLYLQHNLTPSSTTTWQLTDLRGRVLLSQPVGTSTVEFDVSHLSSGVYLSRLLEDGVPLRTDKVVVK